MKTLSERLQHAMITRGIRSQSELARLSGVQQSIISKILSNINETSKYSGKLAAALGISADWLINGTGSMDGVGGEPIQMVDASRIIDLWDENGRTNESVTWPERLPERYRAYRMPRNTGVAQTPEGAIVIVDPESKPGNGDLVVTNINGVISTYRFLEGGAGAGFLSVDDNRVPLAQIPDPSCIIGVVEQTFVKSFRK